MNENKMNCRHAVEGDERKLVYIGMETKRAQTFQCTFGLDYKIWNVQLNNFGF